MSELAADTVWEGAIIWIKEMGAGRVWDCPAVVTELNVEGNYFCIRPLDGTATPVRFNLDCGPDESNARKSMRFAELHEVAVYLQSRRRAVSSGTAQERQAFEDELTLLPTGLRELVAA